MSDLVLELGSDADVTATVRDRDGNLTDPGGLVFTVTDPSGDATTYTYPAAGITRVGLGVYRLTFTVGADGQHFVRCAATNPNRTVSTVVHGAPHPS